MQRKVYEQARKYLNKQKKWKTWQKVVVSLSCVVVFCTVYALILPAITAKSEVFCGHEEHIHTNSCYSEGEPTYKKEQVCTPGSVAHVHTEICYDEKGNLVCTLEEIEPHIHTDACYEEVPVTVEAEASEEDSVEVENVESTEEVTSKRLICGKEELPEHVHSESCFKTTEITGERKLVCGKEEHQHTLSCFSNPGADIETEEEWKKSFQNVELSGDWSEDLVAIAESQLGYKESTKNYIVAEDGETMNGYTRYGAWYGNTYGEWCAMYVSFCLYYAEVEDIPLEAGCQNWINKLKEQPYELYREVGTYTPQRGDLIFFNLDELSDSDHVGIVVEYMPGTETEPAKIKTIEGNSAYQVRYSTYDANDSSIMGYAQLPEEEGQKETAEDMEGLLETENASAETEEFTIIAQIYTDDSYKILAEEETVITITGLMPEGIEAKAFPAEVKMEGHEVIYAYDISLFQKDGTIYEPEADVKLRVEILSPDLPQDVDGVTPGMYYVPEEGTPEMVGSSIEEGKVSFEAGHFSVYALAVPANATKVSTSTDLKDAINRGDSYIQLSADISRQNTLAIPENKEITLDLNGHTLTHTGTATLFAITNAGAKLIIVDSQMPSEKVTGASGDLYGNTASVTIDQNQTTLTYYVTTSAVENTATGATAETLEKHTITTGGAIVAGSQTVFNVETNGTLEIQSGMVRSGTGRAINQTGGTVTLSGGYICGFSRTSSSTSNTDAFGGAIYTSGGSFKLTGSVIAGNFAQNGGAIYATGSTQIIVSAGIISGNTANRVPTNGWNGHSEKNELRCGGGGIYADESAKIVMSGGYITNNVATDKGYFDGGGGVCLSGASHMELSGGYVTGNKAQGGGGIRTDFGKTTIFEMSGGHVSANVATEAEGGGIAIDRNGTGTITGGYITNNRIPNTVHWGGGGLFCADGSTLNLKRVLITENEAGGFGAGVAGCPTGNLYLYINEGCAIYDNEDVIDSDSPHYVNGGVKNDIDVNRCTEVFQKNGHADYFCALRSTVTNQILGGGYANWQGSADYNPVIAQENGDEFLSANEVMGLQSHLTEEAKANAQNGAKVYVNGNYSYTHGGGILCNGNLIIGNPTDVEVPVHLAIQGTKSFVSNTGTNLSLDDNHFVFTVTDENGNEVAEGTCDANGKITFDRQIVLGEEGTFVYTIKEKVPENSDSDIQYDSAEYTLSVMVKKDSGTSWYGDTMKYTYQVTGLEVTKKNADGTIENVAVDTSTQNGIITVLPDEEKIAFTNVKTDVIDMKVVKEWEGKTPSNGKVTVHLYRNDEMINTQELSASNNWQYIWENLPTKDDAGNPYQYHITEEHVNGYVTTYEEKNEGAVHTVVITNTDISVAKFDLDLTKVSKEEAEFTLAGAEFELLDSSGNQISFVGENGSYTVSDSNVEGAVTTVITIEGGKLYLKELSAGTYTLKETKAPEGYDLMEDKKITLDEFSDKTIEITLEDPEKVYEIPETGGNGTMMLYLSGSVLILGAVILLITKKRMHCMK